MTAERPVTADANTAPRVAVIGGGTGSFTLLRDLKDWTPHLTAIVNMADDGGSTGVLRDELGVLPPGDIRQCLVALSQAPQELRDLFSFRFPRGSLAGHSFGNLFLSAVESMTDDFADAVRLAGDVLRITGQVVPVALEDHHLVLEQSGRQAVGQYRIIHTKLQTKLQNGPRLYLQPQVRANPAALAAIRQADLVVIAPGNLYGSLAPALLVQGVGEALAATAAPVVYVCNLVNKSVQTPDFAVHDYAAEIERLAGAAVLDEVLYNVDVPSDEVLRRYALEGEYPVLVDATALERAHYRSTPGNFLSHGEHSRQPNDNRIMRSLIRHDGRAVTAALRGCLA